MALAQETLSVIDQVERLSGRRVEMVADPNLPTLATVRTARGGASIHVVTYKPDASGVDYNVAFQCAFTLRLYQVRSEDRVDFTSVEAGRGEVRRMLAGPGGTLTKLKVTTSVVNQFTDQVFDGALLQLRSVPIGMRIDEWLWSTYPGLREAQRDSLGSQQRTNAQALGPSIRAIVPPPLFAGNAAMNAAYALFCDRLLETSIFAVPYRSAGFEDRGKILIGLCEELPASPEHDRSLVDAWGAELGLSDWYTWRPFQP